MRLILYTVISIYFFSSNIVLLSQNKPNPQSAMRVNLIVDTSCAKCQFDKKSDKDCLLAVEIHSDIYYVEGTTIDDHGDAHASDGFCNVVRKAHVEGIIDDGRFYLDKFRLLKYREKKKLYSN